MSADQPPAGQGRSERPSVLIVDDHPSFRSFAHRLLRSAGFRVVGEAPDGESALRAARRLRPDVVLLDVLLPDMSGFAVADELAADRAPPTVVLISSRSAADLGTRLRTTRARAFITKSELTPDSLTAAIRGAA